MPENETFWDFYWEIHLQPMRNLGKRFAILAASDLIRRAVSAKQAAAAPAGAGLR